MATRRPAGSGWQDRKAAASISSPRLRVAMMPAWPKSASWVTSGVAEAAVCDAAARWPATDRPPMTVSTGSLRPTRRAVRANPRGLPNDSTYSMASLVCSSCSHHVSMSLLDTSYLSPTEANDDTPRPSRRMCSSSAIPMPPDCMTSPAMPGAGMPTAKVALRRACVDAIPKQLGPTRRIPYRRQIASSSAPPPPRLAVITMSDRTPRSAAGRCHAGHLGWRHGDNGEIDAGRQVRRRGEACQPFHRAGPAGSPRTQVR